MLLHKFIIIFQFFIHFSHCQKGEMTYHSLLLTQDKNEFYFTKSASYDSTTHTSKFSIPKDHKTYHFCPCAEMNLSILKKETALCYKKKIRFSKTATDGKKCRNLIQSTLEKVSNPNELKNKWNRANLELYHSGFTIYTKDLETKSIADKILCFASTQKTSSEEQQNIKPKYTEWNNDYDFMPVLAIYYDEKLEQTIAVEYELLSIPEYDQNNEVREFLYTAKFPLGTPKFYKYTTLDPGLPFFNHKVGDWRKYIDENVFQSVNQIIKNVAFAPAEHFQVKIWQQAITIRPNLSIIWYKGIYNWKKMESLARLVAKHYGNLKVTTGNTGIMSLPYVGDDLSQYIDGDTSKPKLILLQDENEKITIPNYIWKTLELFNNGKWYGILVVMHINIYTDDTENICDDICNENGWLISNSDYTKGKMYCCEMTRDNIAKLDADFLSLTERNIFNLHNWQKQYRLMLNDFIFEYGPQSE